MLNRHMAFCFFLPKARLHVFYVLSVYVCVHAPLHTCVYIVVCKAAAVTGSTFSEVPLCVCVCILV